MIQIKIKNSDYERQKICIMYSTNEWFVAAVISAKRSLPSIKNMTLIYYEDNPPATTMKFQ